MRSPEDIRETLRNAIRKSELSVRDIADAAAVNHSQLYRFLNGSRELRSDSLARIARFLQLELREVDDG